MKKISNILIYIAVGLFSFVFFLYLSFPYNILKETIAVQLSSAMGASVSINELGPRFLLGLSAEGVKITSSTKTVELKRIRAQVGLLSLFLGKVQVNLDAEDAYQGILDLSVGIGIIDLISGNPFPSSVSVETNKFTFGNFAELALKLRANAPGTSPLLKPVLEKISVAGKINTNIQFSINTSDFSRSSGSVNITLIDSSIDFDPSMQIASQKFESAIIRANSQGGTFTFDPASRLKTQDIDISFTGKIIEKTKIEHSVMDMEVKIEIFKDLKNTFSVVLNALAGKDADGKLSVKIAGPVIPGPAVTLL